MAAISILSLPFSNNFEIAKLVEKGLPAKAITALADNLGVSVTELGEIIQIPARTLQRRIAANSTLKIDESDRLTRLARLYAKAVDVFESEKNAADWFSEPLEVLGGVRPLALCHTEAGAREIERILGRIEHGVFA